MPEHRKARGVFVGDSEAFQKGHPARLGPVRDDKRGGGRRLFKREQSIAEDLADRVKIGQDEGSVSGTMEALTPQIRTMYEEHALGWV